MSFETSGAETVKANESPTLLIISWRGGKTGGGKEEGKDEGTK